MHRILLVEDDARLAKMVADYLAEAGFRVTHAPTGMLTQNTDCQWLVNATRAMP